MSAPLLQLRDVSFRYAGREILHDVNLSLETGSATALIGPNGIGKTTLLRLISGLLQPASGTVELGSQPLGRLSTREAARQIALVPQQLEVPFDYTVQQIVEQGRTPYLALLGGLRAADKRQVDRALDLTSTTSLRHRVFNELSGGERQRVKIALGLAQQPRLLLLDEPTQNLDIGRQVELLDLLRSLREGGLTILASLHDLHLIAGNFPAVILMRPSAPMLYGPADRLLGQSMIEEAFRCSVSNHPILEQLAHASLDPRSPPLPRKPHPGDQA